MNFNNFTSRSALTPSASEFIPSSGNNQTPNLNVDYDQMSSMSGMNLSASSWVPSSGNNNNFNNNIDQNTMNNRALSFNKINNHNINNNNYPPTGRIASSTFTPPFDPSSDPYHAINEFENSGSMPSDFMDLDYAALALPVTLPSPPKRSLQTVGLPEPIRQHFQSLDIQALKQMSPEDPRYKEIPMRFHSAHPLDIVSAANRGGGGSFGYPSSVYKVIDRADSQIYVLRRFDPMRNIPQVVVANALKKWSEVRHPNIVSLYSISIDRALFFAYSYYPAAVTLKQRFVDNNNNRSVVSEALLWRILVQLLSAIKSIHQRNMAVRVIDPIHVLMTSGTNVRINCVGVPDVLEFESRKNVLEMMQEDLIRLGRLMLTIITRTIVSGKNAEEALIMMKQHYGPELQRVVVALLHGKSSAAQISSMILDRIFDELETANASCDALHSNLRNEYENGRLLRMLMKLGFMNERPENPLSPQWSETGDRYVLKLFRDYVFHQCSGEIGGPVIDAGHVISVLNKVDVGDTEELLLSSRDGKDLLVVTYADVKRCVESSFMDLLHQEETSKMITTSNGSGSGDFNNNYQNNQSQQQYYNNNSFNGNSYS